jgi:GMP synthase-like glutamine amidotransferase
MTLEDHVVLEATVGDAPRRRLNLCCLGCEDNPPYGPTHHTATMILNILKQTAEYYEKSISIHITVFRVQQMDYPPSFRDFDGVLLPGSFSSAYDEDEWILKLKSVIVEELWPRGIPTWAICFGHQVLAHALPGGLCTKTPAGPQAGCCVMESTPDQPLSSSKRISLLYTHGDMVKQLPDMACSLGGNSKVPIQSAVYCKSDVTTGEVKPVFVTFQAHPEYASEGPEQPTLKNIMEAMQKRKEITVVQAKEALSEVQEHWDDVYMHSLDVVKKSCDLLGWFDNIGDQ